MLMQSSQGTSYVTGDKAMEAARQAAAAADAARAAAHVEAVTRVPMWGHAAVCAVSVTVTIATAAWLSHKLHRMEEKEAEVLQQVSQHCCLILQSDPLTERQFAMSFPVHSSLTRCFDT